MALLDWNGDGKKDLADDFIEYQIFRNVTNVVEENDHSYSCNNARPPRLTAW